MSGKERVREEGHSQEIAVDMSWLRQMKQKADNARWKVMNKTSPTILRVPASILATNPEAYKPKIISLGPFHRQRLQEWEDRIKWPYLNRFLARTPHLDMLDYIEVIKILEREARSAYPKPLEMDGNEFAEMMLLDCCFLLELLLVEHQKEMEAAQKRSKDKANQKQWTWKHFLQQQQQQPTQPSPQQRRRRQQEEDPIASIVKWALPLIRHDILILENQLPLFLLGSLFEKASITCSTHGPITFEDLILNFFRNFSLFPAIETSDITSLIEEGQCHHLLHLFHSCMRPRMPPGDDDRRERLPIRCARELREAKVKLVKKSTWSVLDISFQNARFYDVASFWRCRLEIPQLWIDDDTDTLFRSLIAFEQCFPEVGDHVSAYAWFMDSIVDNNVDVALLRKRDIVVNGLGSDKDVANLFNQLCKEVPVDLTRCYLGKVVNEVTKHCEKSSNKCWAALKRTYFSNPWAGVSVAAAIILFVLTLLQTIYTILGYLKPQGN